MPQHDARTGQFFCAEAMAQIMGDCALDVRTRLWLKHAGRCTYCGRLTVLHGKSTNGNYATKDHRKVASRGGENALRNYVLACRRCNGLRCDLDENVFRERLAWFMSIAPLPEWATPGFRAAEALITARQTKKKPRVRVFAKTQGAA
jgi:hypothetical protein